MNQRHPRLFALVFTASFFILIALYVREFPVLANTIGGRWLVLGSMMVGLTLAGLAIWQFRSRFLPWDRHIPDVLFICISAVFFAPLLGSYANRFLGEDTHQSFTFVSETPFIATGYGLLKGEKIQPNGYRLVVEDAGNQIRFSYKSQAYYPLTHPGETVMLPIRKGIFGARVMLLK